MSVSRWDGSTSDKEHWWIEIEPDAVTSVDPFGVALEVGVQEGEGWETTVLAMPSPEQARQMAEALCRAADHAEESNARRVAQDLRR